MAQRYVAHLPTAGEIVMFDRSWYNRAGVEKVMGFCTRPSVRGVLPEVAHERLLVDDGIALTGSGSPSPRRAAHRFLHSARSTPYGDGLSPTDAAPLNQWMPLTRPRSRCSSRTNTDVAPWTVIRSNDKKRARLDAMRSLLSGIDYDRKDPELVGRPDPLIVGTPADMREMDPGLLSPTPLARIHLGRPAPE